MASFGQIYRHLGRCGDAMKPSSRVVLINLLERLGSNRSAWPDQETIAQDTGQSVRTVKRAVAELASLGFLTRRRRGMGLSNEYSIDVAALQEWAQAGPAGPSGPSSGATTGPSVGTHRPLSRDTQAPQSGHTGPTTLLIDEDPQKKILKEDPSTSEDDDGDGVLEKLVQEWRDCSGRKPTERERRWIRGEITRRAAEDLTTAIRALYPSVARPLEYLDRVLGPAPGEQLEMAILATVLTVSEPEPQDAELWELAREQLRETLNPSSYSAWIADLALAGRDEAGALVLRTPHAVHVEWLEQRYSRLLERAVAEFAEGESPAVRLAS